MKWLWHETLPRPFLFSETFNLVSLRVAALAAVNARQLFAA
jgi:hypothetical protein